MAEALFSSPWGYRGLFAGLAGMTFFVRLLPVETMPRGVPGPDLMLCLTLAWVLRRPDYVPAVLIVAVFLLEDMLLMRPPGLWAVIVLLAAEFLRAREALFRELNFPIEWALVAALMVAMMLAERLVLAVTMVPQAGLGLSLLHLLASVLAYPVVVMISRFGFGVRKSAPGEVDDRGRPL